MADTPGRRLRFTAVLAEPPAEDTVVCLRSGHEALANLDGRLPLQPAPHGERLVWSGSLEVPASFASTTSTGSYESWSSSYAVICEIRYALERGTQITYQSSSVDLRLPIEDHYFHRPSFPGGRIYGTSDKAFDTVLRCELAEVQHGLLTPRDFLERYDKLESQIRVYGTTAEDVLDVAVLSIGDGHVHDRAALALCYAAVVGNWKAGVGRWSYSNTPMRELRPWCNFVVEGAMFAQRNGLEALLGPRFRWALLGLGEASERLYQEGEFGWLPLLPLLRLGLSAPAARSSREAASKLSEGFERAAAAALAGEARGYLRALVGYAPSLRALLALVHPALPADPDLLHCLHERLKTLDFGPGDRVALEAALVASPALACEATAGALLENDSLPSRYFTEHELMVLVGRLVGEVAPSESLAQRLKRWLRAQYCKEEQEPEEDNLGMWGMGWGTWHTVKPKKSPEELARKQAEQLNAAHEAWARWLALPCFQGEDEAAERARSVAFELTQAHFVKRSAAIPLITLILALDSKPAHTALREELARCARHAAQDVEEEAIMKLLTSPSAQASTRLQRLDIANELASTKGGAKDAEPALRPLLASSSLWVRLLSWKEVWAVPEHPLEASCRAARDRIRRLCGEVESHDVTLADLRVVQDSGQQSLERLAAASQASWGGLEACFRELAAFDRKLAMVQCYVSLFCRSAGIRVDELEDELEDVQSRLGELQLGEVDVLFEDLSVLPLIPWLYELRGSEVFLELWTRTARAAPVAEAAAAAQAAAEAAAAGDHPGFTITLCGEECALGDYTYQGERNNRPHYICADKATHVYFHPSGEWRIYTTGAHRHADATLYRCQTDTPDVPMAGWAEYRGVPPAPTIQMVTPEHEDVPETTPEELIGTARQEYLTLIERTREGTATVGELASFVRLPWSQVQRELALMRTTAASEADWTPLAQERLQALRVLERVRRFAPGVLHLRSSLASLFADEAEATARDHEVAAGLEAVVERTREAEGCPLSDVAAVIAPCKPATAGLSELQLDFTTALAAHDGLLEWLLRSSDTEQFNRLIKVVRPYTDNPRLLEALASLQQLRARVAELLYQRPPYTGAAAFLQELARVEVGEQELMELRTVQATFELVLELLTCHTRAPGVQALHEMRSISDGGRFIFTCVESESRRLVCHFGEARTLCFEELVEMRRLLLMTDIPQEMEGAAQMPQLVADFVAKLQVLEGMGAAVAQLFDEGHFGYAAGAVAFELKAGTALEELGAVLQRLQLELEAWRSAVAAARSAHYFLNYFRARELQLLAVELPRLRQSTHAEEAWVRLWPLLRLAAPRADEAALRERCTSLSTALPSEAGEAIEALGALLTELLGCCEPAVRAVPLPRQVGAVGDLLVQGAAGGGGLVFVCCAESERAVTELVLSVFARRGRLPEPEEVLMCTGATSGEELELLLRRFARARSHGRSELVFCVANVHLLSYAVQCATVEALRRLEAAPGGFEAASALLFVSGEAEQMLPNALADRQIAAAPLSRDALRGVLAAVAQRYCGSVEAVAAEINGAGKTHHILRRVQQLQEQHGAAVLHYVALRETTTAGELVQALLADPTDPTLPTAIYLDLAHILPVSADVWLFELLVVGTLRDPIGGRVYHRRPQDHFLLEIPNSPNERTASSLAFCALLPVTFLRMEAGRLEFERPFFPNEGGNVVFIEDDHKMLTCHFLEAMNSGTFNPGSDAFDINWIPELEEPVEPQDGYASLLAAACGDGSPPSFQLFSNFASIVGAQFQRVQAYELLNMEVLQLMEMPDLRQCFCRMLLETSADFSLRQIPKAQLDTGGEFAAAALRPPPRLQRERSGEAPPPLTRLRSVELQRELSGAAQVELVRLRSDQTSAAAEEAGGAGRIESANYVRRFDHMISWEHSEHPVVVFYRDPSGITEGIDVFSLNNAVVDRYIGRNLKAMLEAQGIEIAKNWKNIKSAEAVRLLRRIEGWSADRLEAEPPRNYVVTVDNFLKVLSIQLRLNCGLPVVLMGETGCGKTALVRFLAEGLGYELRTLDVHGGIGERDVVAFVGGCLDQAAQLPAGKQLLVFLDEINAANCMGLFKTVLLDRRLGSRLIPDTVRLIACCNPYRFRQAEELEEVALVYNHHAKDAGGLADPMRHLVYRVHPLPESLIDIVYDFGALTESTEELYVEAVLRKELPDFESAGDEVSGETVLTCNLAGDAGSVRVEHEVLADQPAGSIVADVNCLDDEGVQEQKGDAFGVTDDKRRVWMGSDVQGTFEVRVLDVAAAKRADERRRRRKEAKESKQRQAASSTGRTYGTVSYSSGGSRSYWGSSYGAGGTYSYGTYYGGYGGYGSYGGTYGGVYGYDYWSRWAEPSDYEQFLLTFKALICASQSFVREANGGERSVVSLRDVARAAKVFKWFLRYYSELQGDFVPSGEDQEAEHIQVSEELRPHLRSAVILTLGYCYHSRLTREQRAGYRERLCSVWRKMLRDNPGVQWLNLESPEALLHTVEGTQHAFVAQMDLGEGIALNEALRENLFMLLVSVMNRIPILVIGKPGCSKSLAMEVLQSNLNGEVSANAFFKSMPAVEVFPYQCSPLSTPEGVQGAFDSARRYRVEGSRTIVCVLLDEVGLAEESPHLPLKVLHRELEHLGGLACVGLSNWSLDAAKMSRCVTLYRPPPTVEDLCATAEGMVASQNLRGYLQSLSRAFFEVYGRQQRPDFWGLREFYSTVRVVNAALKRQAEEEAPTPGAAPALSLEPALLMKTVQRNYGGRPPSETDDVVGAFFRECGMAQDRVPRLSTAELIRQNLRETEARHLMLLTRNNAALQLLFDAGLVDHTGAEVLFGSTFRGDQGDVAVASMLQSIKAMMRRPMALVLVHCDSLYESLYDLLNQHYMEYGGQRYVRIAHGSSSRQCPIHRLFRVVVVTEVSDAYHRLAPPLLNRFEKQILLRDSLLTDADQQLTSVLQRVVAALVRDICRPQGRPAKDGALDAIAFGRLLPGAHPGLLASLALAARMRAPAEAEQAGLVQMAMRQLVWVMRPEAICGCIGQEHLELRDDFGLDVVREYFSHQQHKDLPSFVQWLEQSRDSWCDAHGAQACVFTRAPAGSAPAATLRSSGVSVECFSLHELTSSQDLRSSIAGFYAGEQKLLLVQADLAVCPPRMLEHCRFECEKARAGCVQEGQPRLVILLVHLQQGGAQQLSFDFDAKWWHAFLDDLQPQAEQGLPLLAQMLQASLCELISNLNLDWLMRHCFRGALARLVYPSARSVAELRAQIQLLLDMLGDADFVALLREPFVAALGRCAATSHAHWHAQTAGSSREVALAGTFQAALHQRIIALQTEALVVQLAALDRNGGLATLRAERSRWLAMAQYVLSTPVQQSSLDRAVAGGAPQLQEVGHDALSAATPFQARFPFSSALVKAVDGLRGALEGVPGPELLGALEAQFQLLELRHAVSPELDGDLLQRYLADFAAMQLESSRRVSREGQADFLRRLLSRPFGREPASVLEVHVAFWQAERTVRFGVGLLDAVPAAAEVWHSLIKNAESDAELCVQLLQSSMEVLLEELLTAQGGHNQGWFSDWLAREEVVRHMALELASAQQVEAVTALLPRLQLARGFLELAALPLSLGKGQMAQWVKRAAAAPFTTGALREILLCANELLSAQGAAAAMGGLLEHWILEVCLEATTRLPEDCLTLICSLAAGRPALLSESGEVTAAAPNLQLPQGLAVLPAGVLPRSRALDLAMLRRLLEAPRALELIKGLLCERAGQLLDTPLATHFVAVEEERAEARVGTEEWHVDPDAFAEGAAPEITLRALAEVRCMVGRYARALLRGEEAAEAHQRALACVLEDGSGAPVRLLRLLVLKHLQRAVGTAQVRAMLAEPPLSTARWVAQWREGNDVAFERFVGAARLPQWNPFPDAKGYMKGAGAIGAFMGSIDAEKLCSFGRFIRGLPRSEGRRALGVLLMACCEEPGLRKAIEEGPEPRWRAALAHWLLTTDELPLEHTLERNLLLLFTGEASAMRSLVGQDAEGLSLFEVGPSTTMEQMLQFRVLAHLAAALLSAPDVSVLALLRDMAFAPEKLAGSFLPGMQEDLHQMLQKAMHEQDANIWTNSAHWYTCPKGHSYFIADCGRPMEQAVCPECGERIGGKQHTSEAGNTQMADEDTSPAGYTLKAADVEESDADTVRGLPRSSGQAVRVLLHGAMLLGLAARARPTPPAFQAVAPPPLVRSRSASSGSSALRRQAGTLRPGNERSKATAFFKERERSMEPLAPKRDLEALLPKRDSSSSEPMRNEEPMKVFAELANKACMSFGDSEAVFVRAHFDKAWRDLVESLGTNAEDLAGTLHLMLAAARESSGDEPAGGRGEGGAAAWTPLSLKQRLAWERTLHARYLEPCFQTMAAKVPAAIARWGGGEAEMLVAELRETGDVPCARVLAHRAVPSTANLRSALGSLPRGRQDFPLSSVLLEPPLLEFLGALRHLADVLRWHQLVSARLSCRVERARVRALPVREALLELVPHGEREEWRAAFEGYRRAWACAWKFVERYECTPIPAEYAGLDVTEETPLSFLIVDPADEGLCPLAFTQWLVQQHNQVVSLVAAVCGRENAAEVSSRALGSQDVFQYSEAKLLRFLRARCLSYGAGGRLEYDFVSLERHLRRELRAPLVKWEHKKFRFLDEQVTAGSALRAVIPQRPLARDLQARLQGELGSVSVARSCAQLVEQSIAFLLSTGSSAVLGEDAGGTPLATYLRTVLLVSERLPSKTAELEVRLWHLDAFLQLLQSLLELDPMEGVASKYRAELNGRAEASLREAAPELDLPVLLAALRRVAAEQLREQCLGAEEPMKRVLEVVETEDGGDLGDLLWFQDSFPLEGLCMKHWVAVHRLLNDL